MIFYFSGTGNSRYCAKWLAHRLGDEAVDAFPFLRDGRFPALTSRSPWVFVSPTYGWQLPRIFEALLRGGRFSGSRDAYFVMTCGAEIGDPIPRLEALCRDMGLTYRGVLPVVMPENYIALFRAPGRRRPTPSWQPRCRAGGGGGAHPPGRVPPARPARSDRQAQIWTGERLLLPLYHQGRPLPLHQRLRGLRQMRRSLCGKQYPPPGRPPCVGGPVHPLYGLHLRMSCRSH